MGKFTRRNEEKDIAKAVISDSDTKNLESAKAFLESLLEYRRLEKLKQTYIDGVAKAIAFNGKDKVYVDFRLDGTATGRLSCATSKAKENMGVSFHTLPRETEINIRKMFSAPKNKVFITADYSAMELRVLAHVSDDPQMRQAFVNGEDLHTYTARLLFNKEEISKEERQIAKTVSFLIVYGGGAFNLSESMGISMSKAEKIISQYKRVYPQVFKFMDKVQSEIPKSKYTETIFGRRRHLQNIASPDKGVISRSLRQGFNFIVQSTASDILLCSLVGISKRIKEEKLDANIVATVHDSIEIIASIRDMKEVCEIIYDEMVNYPLIKKVFGINFSVPLKIDMEVGTSFGDGNQVIFENGMMKNEGGVLAKVVETKKNYCSW